MTTTTVQGLSAQEESPDSAPGNGDASRAMPASLRFADLFTADDMQRIQDAFSAAANVASIITDLEGRPLTRPSHFTEFCERIRATPLGLANCRYSDERLRRMHRDREAPSALPCASSGLLDGGTGISVGGRHMANWLIGQVLDEAVDPESLVPYAATIGVDETAFRDALAKVPRMSRERFQEICQALHLFANHLSSLALRNYRREQLIANLRQARASLRARDRRLADIIDFLPDPTLVIGENGTIVFWNRALEQLTGVKAEDMLGKGDFEYATAFYGTKTPLLADYARGAVSAPDSRYEIADLKSDAIIAEVDVFLATAGHRRIWAKAVALRDETGRITGAIEAVRDVTDRHRAKMALRESEEKYRRIVETASEGVWVVDVANRTTFVNRRMADMLGLAPEDMFGRAPESFLAPGQAEGFRCRLPSENVEASDSAEMLFTKKDGGLIWTLASVSPLHDASGKAMGTLGMFTDITDRKRVEAQLADHRQHLEEEVERRTSDLSAQAMELAEANIRLSELDRLKSLFLSTVSHELRTPLTSILGFAKLAARDFTEHFLPLAGEGAPLSGKGRRIAENLHVVFKEAERLTRLINDVLDLSRIESGAMEWSEELIDAAPIVVQTAGSLAGMLAERESVGYHLDMEPGPHFVRFDPDHLVQVLTNLLDNAVKFTKDGEVRVGARRDGDSLLLTVRDTGVGIPEGELESIFDKFHQLRRGDTVDDTNKGTGLGLAICRQIVTHYGGRIWAESEPGRGSTFHVRLPLITWDTATTD